MSRLASLIQSRCPAGVEQVPLWSVTIWDKKFKGIDRTKQKKIISYPYLLADDLFALQQDNGSVFLLSTGEKTGWTTESLAGSNLCEGEVVTIPWGKSRPVVEVIKYYKGKFVTADNRIATSSDTGRLRNKFLYYWMLSQGKKIDRFYRGDGLKHPSMKAVLEMRIPLPPVEIQDEIINILDNFSVKNTQLIEDIATELELRRTQYSYYRELLLSPKDNWTSSTLLSTLVQPITDGPHETPTLVESGVPFISAEAVQDNQIHFDLMRGFITEEYDELCCRKYKPQLGDIYMCKSGSTTGKVAMVETTQRFNIWSPLAAIRVNPEVVVPRFMFFFLQTRFVQKQVKQKASKGSQPNLSMRKLEQFTVCYPDVKTQEAIIQELEQLSSSIAAYSKELDDEISLRRGQLEYYIEKLLSFETAC